MFVFIVKAFMFHIMRSIFVFSFPFRVITATEQVIGIWSVPQVTFNVDKELLQQ